MTSTTTAPAATAHPLDPLTAAEIERAWEILTAERSPGSNSRVIFIMLHEPDKKVVLGHRPGDAVERAAFVVLVDGATGRTHEAVVSLSRGRVLSWEHLPGVQPAIVFDEFVECDQLLRTHPDVIAALGNAASPIWTWCSSTPGPMATRWHHRNTATGGWDGRIAGSKAPLG